MSYKKYRKKLPSYGKIHLKTRQEGKVPLQIVMVVFDWDLAKAYPRIVLPPDIPLEELEFAYLAGLPVQIIYHNKDAYKIDALVQIILKVNPSFLSTFSLDLLNTGRARTLIKPFEEIQTQEVA